MILFHLWLYLSMSIVFIARVYITLQKKRMNPDEKKIELIIDCIFAVLFTIAFMDIFFTIPQIIDIMSKINVLIGG